MQTLADGDTTPPQLLSERGKSRLWTASPPNASAPVRAENTGSLDPVFVAARTVRYPGFVLAAAALLPDAPEQLALFSMQEAS